MSDRPPEIDDAALQALFADPEGPVGRYVERKCYEVENLAKALLLLPGTGRIYRRGKSAVHQASAPDEPAVSDTGQLLNSVGHTVSVDGGVVTGRVGSGLEHALYTELGTRYMAPRPWLRPALDIAVHGARTQQGPAL